MERLSATAAGVGDADALLGQHNAEVAVETAVRAADALVLPA